MFKTFAAAGVMGVGKSFPVRYMDLALTVAGIFTLGWKLRGWLN